MNNIANLGATAVAPAVQGLSGQTASQGDNSSLFSALLMQQMGPDLSGTGGAQMADLGQSLSGNADLAKILPALVAQSKDAKLSLPVNRQTDTAADGTQTNPAMALLLASMAAQIQPNVQNPLPQSWGIGSQPVGPGAERNATLQALEQQFPGLALALKDKHLAAGNNTQGTQAASNKADQESVDVKAADVKVPDAKPVDTKNDFSTVNATPSEAIKVEIPHTAVPANPAVPTDAVTTPGKNRPNQKDLAVSAVVKDNAPAVAPVTQQSQSSDAKPQSDDQPSDSHPGNQARKDSASASTTQVPQVSGPANSASGANATVDPANFAAMTQAAVHNATGSATNHQAITSTSQPVNVNEVSAAVGVEPTPRIVHVARLMEAAGQAEMRVSLKSDTSGTVDVRAVLENGNISATVAAQHGGTRDWMMANMHELQTSLSHDDLNLKTFEVTDTGLQNNGRGDEPRQQEPQQQQRNAAYSNFASETHSTTASFDDVDLPETPSRALSLLA